MRVALGGGMNPNIQIAYRHLPPSEALSAHVESEAARLEKHFGHPLTCHVTIEPARPTEHLKRCRVRVEATARGQTFVAGRAPSEHEGHDDAYLAVREAFRVLRHQLDAHGRPHTR